MKDHIGTLIVDLQSTVASPDELELIQHPLVGGIILFARNYDTRDQLTRLCQQIRSARANPLLIMVDQEGGRVQRFIKEFTRLPSMGTFGDLYDHEPAKACLLAKQCGWLMATELRSVGVDLSLAPVLDLNKGVSTIIGKRSFHAQPEAVIKLAMAFIAGMHEAGMAATGKHFPGHGSVSLDSHVAIPVDQRSMQEIEQDDMIPFAGLIKAGIPALMAAHIIFPKVDRLPVSFSRIWLQDVLRQRMGFNGVIFSDDLNMEGANISANYADRVLRAREAGCDFTLLCNNRKGVIEVLDSLPIAAHQISKEKWQVLQGDGSNVLTDFQVHQRWNVIQAELMKLDTQQESNII